MVKRIFIDTNTLVHYLILSKIEKTKKTTKEKEELWKEYKRIKPSYEFILSIIKSNNNKIKFVTSPLAFSEIFYALYDEYLCRMMWKDGVPFSTWGKIKSKFKKLITPLDIREINKDVNKLKKIKNILIIKMIYDFKLISKLVLKYELRTHDAILFATARTKPCSFFVTTDGDFLQNQSLKNNFKRPKIISPLDASKKFFKKTKLSTSSKPIKKKIVQE